MSANIRLLIVDDSREDCATFQRRLEQGASGAFAFQLAHTVAQGLDVCRGTVPDCVLLDFNLPDGDGLDFLAQLQQELGVLAPAVVMLTGKGNEKVAVEAMKLGAQDYLVKDATADRLRHSIHNSIDCVELRRQVAAQQKALINFNERQTRLLEELQRHAAQLADADRRKNDFLAVLAHELRNPLGPIRNAAQIMQLSIKDVSTELEQAAQIIDRQISHMARLIDDLLDISRIVRGKVRLRLEHLDLRRLVMSTVEDHRVAIVQAGLNLTIDVPDRAVWVDADPTRLSQVIGNLLDNAKKFTPSGGSIAVSLKVLPDNSNVQIEVADTGEGLDTAMLSHMFEVFSQADRSLDRSRGGLGLGLAIVKGIAELHHGSVSATSAGSGQGCKVKMSLPLLSRPEPWKPVSPATNHDTRSLRILVVEDNTDAAQSLKILLERMGHVVGIAYSGATALQLACSFLPELVLCDIGLSDGISGYAVAEALRKDARTASLCLVALTGYGGEEDRKRSLAAGFDLHLTKPMSMEALHELPALVQANSGKA